MSEDHSSHIENALQQQSFLRKVREYLLQGEEQYSALDEEALVLEVDLSFAQQQIASLEKELQKYRTHLESLQVSEAAFQQKISESDLQKSLLKDLESLLSGHFDPSKALFFTQSMLDFASARAWGEMGLFDRLKAVEDPMILDVDGQRYAFLEFADGKYCFHAEALDADFYDLLKGLSD